MTQIELYRFRGSDNTAELERGTLVILDEDTAARSLEELLTAVQEAAGHTDRMLRIALPCGQPGIFSAWPEELHRVTPSGIPSTAILEEAEA